MRTMIPVEDHPAPMSAPAHGAVSRRRFRQLLALYIAGVVLMFPLFGGIVYAAFPLWITFGILVYRASPGDRRLARFQLVAVAAWAGSLVPLFAFAVLLGLLIFVPGLVATLALATVLLNRLGRRVAP